MFNEEVRSMLGEVITSWQVIVATVIILIYISIVRSVGKLTRSRRHNIPKPPKVSGLPPSPAEDSSDDDLGLEESTEE